MRAARRRVAVVGDGVVAAAAAAALRHREDVDVVVGAEAVAGATVLALAGAGDAPRLVARAPSAVVVVSGGGPEVDACLQATLLPRAQVVGTGGVAATRRWRELIGRAAGVSARDVTGLVLGGAGAAAVPAASLTTVGGAPAAEVLGADVLDRVAAAVREAPRDDLEEAAAVVDVVSAVLDDSRRVLACAMRCHGELGIGGASVSVPVVIGSAGAEALLELPLADDELAAIGRASG